MIAIIQLLWSGGAGSEHTYGAIHLERDLGITSLYAKKMICVGGVVTETYAICPDLVWVDEAMLHVGAHNSGEY